MADDDDKTVFGQPLPPRPTNAGTPKDAPQGSPQGRPAPPPRDGSGGDEKTVFGQPLPPRGHPPQGQPQSQPQGPGRVAPGYGQPPASSPPSQGQQPWNTPGLDDTWLGGALTPPARQPGPAAPQGRPPAPQDSWDAWSRPDTPPRTPAPQVPQYQTGTGQRPAGSEIFPDIPRPDTSAQYDTAQRKIALADALKGVGAEHGGSSNPLIRAASNLLILLGRLRTGLVDMQAGPLIDHVTREIDQFERAALEQGAAHTDVLDAKYALSATADDIVQNLPGADRGTWIQYSMVARFFGERASGVGFFQKVDEVMRVPAQRYHLLELMLTCLSLGFEGQYRASPSGAVELARIRTAIYETLRRIAPRPDDDVSPHWSAVPMNGRRRRGGTPVWVVAAVACAMAVALFATLSTLLTRQGAEVRDGILALHTGLPPVTIERIEPVVEPYVAPEPAKLERIRAALADQIASEQVEVNLNNDWIYVRVGDALQFASGKADLTSDFTELSTAIGAALNAETGPVRVVGHTDSVPSSGRGRYKTNQQLSEARAQTVANILGSVMDKASRIEVEGKGSVDPIADNATAAGRARNRRVEIMTPREE